MSRFTLFLLTLVLVGQLNAQSGSSPQQLSFHISPAPSWTDTGLNLQAGDAVMISVVSSGSSQNSSDQCDPAGSNVTAGNAPTLPVSDARPGALIAKLEVDTPAILIGAQRELSIDKN